MTQGKIPSTLIKNIKSREPVRIRERTPLLAVVMTMKKARRGAAVIEDNAGKLIGIITERDLISRINHGTLEWHSIPVNEIMARDPKTIKITQYLHEALGIMLASKFRHLPVVDSDNHVISIMSVRDIITYVASLYPQEFLNLPPDPNSEASGRYGG